MKIVVSGASRMEDVPGLDAALKVAEVAFAPDADQLARHLDGSNILLGWNFRGRDLESQWQHAGRLKWIHWCGAGVDAVLFPALAESDTVLTNARGIFDRAMAEYVLGYMLSEVKGFRRTFEMQAARTWDFRLTDKLEGSRAIVFGTGSIGHEIGRLLKSVGVEVTGAGRSRRSGDPVFGEVLASSGAMPAVAEADWVISVMPLTPDTENFFDASFFAAMKPSARFVNLGRGRSVDEAALLAALNDGQIAGAMLDVYTQEPLPDNSPLWTAPNLTVSPHMSGDYNASQADMVAQFLANLDRFIAGKPLANVVDKQLGFVRSDTPQA
jgi:phosphoglycerate dehydrogenase-like enzyme